MNSNMWNGALVQSSADSIIGMSKGGAIQSWNEASSRLYGYSATEKSLLFVAMIKYFFVANFLCAVLQCDRLALGDRVEVGARCIEEGIDDR